MYAESRKNGTEEPTCKAGRETRHKELVDIEKEVGDITWEGEHGAFRENT